jgi:EAL domain-containing protein (putative c-di-GMP-specific phosphodiesterase class I)
VALAQVLGISITVEGVESIEQAAFLRKFAFVDVQGFLFGRPMQPWEIQPSVEIGPSRPRTAITLHFPQRTAHLAAKGSGR